MGYGINSVLNFIIAHNHWRIQRISDPYLASKKLEWPGEWAGIWEETCCGREVRGRVGCIYTGISPLIWRSSKQNPSEPSYPSPPHPIISIIHFTVHLPEMPDKRTHEGASWIRVYLFLPHLLSVRKAGYRWFGKGSFREEGSGERRRVGVTGLRSGSLTLWSFWVYWVSLVFGGTTPYAYEILELLFAGLSSDHAHRKEMRRCKM